jgi:hypothetical protein
MIEAGKNWLIRLSNGKISTGGEQVSIYNRANSGNFNNPILSFLGIAKGCGGSS